MRNTKLLFALPLFAFGLVACGSKTPTDLNVFITDGKGALKGNFQINEEISKDQIEVNAKSSDGTVRVGSDQWTSDFFGSNKTYKFEEKDIGEKIVDVSYLGIKKTTTIKVKLDKIFNAHFEINDKKIESGEFVRDKETTVKLVLENDYKKEWINSITYKDGVEDKCIEITPDKDDMFKFKVKGVKETPTIAFIDVTINTKYEDPIYKQLNYSVIKGEE